MVEVRKGHGPGDTTETHPAYAQIGAGRVSGQTNLYGSDFTHHHYVCIRIKGSVLHRGLSNDWPHAREEYIEVAMSEAQWATFVSTMNSGEGVQCTLERRNGVMIDGIEHPPSRKHQFTKEMAEHLQEVKDRVKKLEDQINDSKMPAGTKKELLNNVHHVRMGLGSNLKFVGDMFGEHMEKTTEKAKIEVNAFMESRIHRAGLAALQGAGVPFTIADQSPVTLQALDDLDKP